MNVSTICVSWLNFIKCSTFLREALTFAPGSSFASGLLGAHRCTWWTLSPLWNLWPFAEWVPWEPGIERVIPIYEPSENLPAVPLPTSHAQHWQKFHSCTRQRLSRIGIPNTLLLSVWILLFGGQPLVSKGHCSLHLRVEQQSRDRHLLQDFQKFLRKFLPLIASSASHLGLKRGWTSSRIQWWQHGHSSS